MSNTKGYTERDWDHSIGWGTVPSEHALRHIETSSAPQEAFDAASGPQTGSDITPVTKEPFTQAELSRIGCDPGWLENNL